MAGQINLGTSETMAGGAAPASIILGNAIYNLSSIKTFSNYVEVGTWNGQGSTFCFMSGLVQRLSDNSCLYSIDADKKFYEQAKHYWSSLNLNQSQKLKLLYGRLVELHDLISVDEISHSPNELMWRKYDVEQYELCENIIDKLPDVIDVLLLDGGEFSTRMEFEKLKDRTSVVVLDDTTLTKNKVVRSNIIECNETWKIILDDLNNRNGILIACREPYYDVVRDAIFKQEIN